MEKISQVVEKLTPEFNMNKTVWSGASSKAKTISVLGMILNMSVMKIVVLRIWHGQQIETIWFVANLLLEDGIHILTHQFLLNLELELQLQLLLHQPKLSLVMLAAASVINRNNQHVMLRRMLLPSKDSNIKLCWINVVKLDACSFCFEHQSSFDQIEWTNEYS